MPQLCDPYRVTEVGVLQFYPGCGRLSASLNPGLTSLTTPWFRRS